jgi:CheY-like chemotaxis protein/signal transduction histidine kinase/HAMP domain-containing protein
MLERLRFRYKVLLLVAPALTGLLVVTAVALLLNRRAESQLARVEDTYLPLLELDRDLERLFVEIQRALEGAAAAKEDSELRRADELRQQFVDRLQNARAALAANGGDAGSLRQDLGDYYRTARDVTTRLMNGQAGEALVERMEEMRTRHDRLSTRLETEATPDRIRMAAAFRAARQSHQQSLVLDLVVALVALLVAAILSWRIIGTTVRSLQEVQAGVERLARGDFSQEIRVPSQDELGELARQSNETAAQLRTYRERSNHEDWVKTGLTGLGTELFGEQAAAELGNRALAYLVRYLQVPVAALYLIDEEGKLRLQATHGCARPESAPPAFGPGEGILGQALSDGELRVLDQLPDGQLVIRTALVEGTPRQILVAPFAHEDRVLGVFELGSLGPLSESQLELVRRARAALGVTFAVAKSRRRQQELLERTQRQAEELQAQQEELRQTNDELAQQGRALEIERQAVMDKNAALEKAQLMLQEKADEVSRSSRYKSEFLANMSHELRTPLNGIMVLSQMLAENAGANLTDKQVEFAQVINKSGQELLHLINEILDLSKIESGHQDLVREPVSPGELASYLKGMWSPIAARKGLLYSVEIDHGLPPQLHTDRMRVEQILKNLLSNAVKFTERGNVEVKLRRAPAAELPARARDVPGFLAVSVTDTGPGVPRDKQQWIFEAFAQVDGGTSRKYGGTGLGLAIAKQLANRLGGDLCVQSDGSSGSTFTLYLPLGGPETLPTRAPAPAAAPARDDRESVTPGEPCLLIIDDDRTFAALVLAMAREAGFKGLVADGGEAGLALARRHRPSGIILDVGLPDMDGWSVMERLRADPVTRSIPVHFVTAAEGADRARTLGAVGFLSKPPDTDQLRNAIASLERSAGVRLRKVLMVEDDPALRAALSTLIASRDIEVVAVDSSDQAFDQLCAEPFGCVVLDLGLPDKQTGLNLLARLRADERTAELPIIVHTGFPLSAEEVLDLEKQPRTMVVIKGERSPQRLKEEVRLFLHRVRRDLPRQRQDLTESVHNPDPGLQGKRILIVDDDMRNVYSLSAFLRGKGLQVEVAADGKAALEKLSAASGIELVLMDIMMPGMDGYETIRRIRDQPAHGKLPIIALTAKAMPGDRQKCLDAGASDYVAKPIDVQRFMTTLRVWLSTGAAQPPGSLR